MNPMIKYALFAQAFALQGLVICGAAVQQNTDTTKQAVSQVISGADNPENTLAANLEAELNEIPNISFQTDNGVYRIYSNGAQIHSIDTNEDQLTVGKTFLIQKALNPLRTQLGLTEKNDCFKGQLNPINEAGNVFRVQFNPIEGGCDPISDKE